MKKNVFFLCFTFMATLFVACQKDVVTSPLAEKRVAKVIEPTQVLNYTYDSQKRFVKMEQFLPDATKFSTTTYDYAQPNKITQLVVTSTQGTTKTLAELDNQGRVFRTTEQDPISNFMDTSKSTLIFYNANSQVIEVKDLKQPVTQGFIKNTVYTYTGDNLTKRVYSTFYASGAPILNYEETWAFNPNIKNSLNSENYGRLNLFGKDNVHAVSNYTFAGMQYEGNGTITRFSQIHDYTYELDSDGNIVKKTEKTTWMQGTIVTNTTTVVTSYVYQ